jgi:hypothetical protein
MGQMDKKRLFKRKKETEQKGLQRWHLGSF